MNNFVFSQDPLLYSTTVPQHTSEMDIKRQLDNVMAQYQAMQQQKPPQPPAPTYEDHLGELDKMTKSLDPILIESLNTNIEYIQLNAYLQEAIQTEIMKDIKSKLNSNPEVVSKVKRLKDIIEEVKLEQENEDRKSMSELNDYIKNYSDMTFNEYKQLKSGAYEGTRV